MPTHFSSPYNTLHIYYIDGCINDPDDDFGPDFIGNWVEEGYSFLFFKNPAQKLVRRILDRHLGVKLLDQYQMTYEEWHGHAFVPHQIAGFNIFPAWHDPKKEAGLEPGKTIYLDPGVVFGTGTHPTTRDCLELLEEAFHTGSVASVIDIGTGTGLLGLAAGVSGARRILALDLNLLAVRTTRNNILLNKLEEHMIVVQGRAEHFMQTPFDLFIANIHYDVMIKLIRSESFLRHRFFILSGLLRSQAKIIRELISELPVTVCQERASDGIWHTFWGKVN